MQNLISTLRKNVFTSFAATINRFHGYVLAIVFLFGAINSNAQVTVTNAVTGNGSYSTLGAAITAIGTSQSSANITIAITASTSETGSVTIGAGTWSSMTISPSGGGARTISGSVSAAPLISLNGAQHVTFDGLNTGSNSLTIANTNSGGSSGTCTIYLTNGSQNNTIRNCTVQGNPGFTASTAIIYFYANSATANSGNTITLCNIGPYSESLVNCTPIFSYGSGTGLNSSNTISNNNIYDFSSYGIYFSTYSGPNWSISGNSFYKTTSYTYTTTYPQYGLYLNSATLYADTIRGNYFGGQSASGGAASTPWNNGTSQAFTAIYFGTSATTSPSLLTANKIQNFTVGSTSTPAFCGIQVGQGAVSIGDGTDANQNVIGNSSSILGITSTGSGAGGIYGIYINSSSSNAVAISDNIIANLSYSGSGSTSSQDPVYGIYNSSGSSASSINNCKIYDLSTACTYTTSSAVPMLAGIYSSATGAASGTITNNTIDSLYATSSAATIQPSYGIYATGTSTNPPVGLIYNNFIHSIKNSSSSTSSITAGIYLPNVGSGCGYNVYNNFIRLGVDASGSSITNSTLLYGIFYGGGSSYNNNFFYNSVYIGGTGVATSVNTYCMYIGGVQLNAGLSNSLIKDNIFYNNRQNSSGSAYNYAIAENGLTLTTITCNYNDLYTANASNVASSVSGSATPISYATWKTNTGFDANSISANPNYNAPDAATATVSLNLGTTPSLCANAGTPITTPISITTDYYGTTRCPNGGCPGGSSAPDLGAYEGNFSIPLYITYTNINSTSSTTAPTLSGVTLTLPSGYSASGTPRLYYKLSTDANSLGATNDHTTTGWKYVAASSGSGTGPYSFTIDYTLLSGSPTIAIGNIIQYFVIAGDDHSEVAINSGTFNGSTPSSLSLTSGAFPIGGTINSYSILNSIGSAYYVGTGGCHSNNYATLTAASTGFFAAMNTGSFVMDKNVTVYITSGITETGATALNNIPQGPGGPFVMTITPCSATAMSVSGASGHVSNTTGLITLNGAQYVTIDGQYSGDGLKHLSLVNTSSDTLATKNYSTIFFENDAAYDTVRNCLIEGHSHSNTSGVVYFGTSTGTIGNSYDAIMNDSIGPIGIGLTPASNDKASQLIYSGGSAAAPNSSNLISNCNLTDFDISDGSGISSATSASAIWIGGTGNGNNWKITANSMYETFSVTSAHAILPFVFNAPTFNDTISYNYIGGHAPKCGGTAWTSSYTGGIIGTSAYCLAYLAPGSDDSRPCVFYKNTINNFTSSVGAILELITPASGSVVIRADTLGSQSIQILQSTAGGVIEGITNSSSNTVTIDSCSIYGFEATPASSTSEQLVGIYDLGTGKMVITNNVLAFLFINSSSSSSLVAGIYMPGITSTNNRIENNQLIACGNLSATSNTSPVYGIFVSGLGASASIKTNNISMLGHEATGGTIVGLYLNDASQNTGTYNVWNNQIYMNNDYGAPPTFSTFNTIYGIQDNGIAGSKSNYFYNTVMIDSAQTGSTAAPSAAFYRFPNKSGSVAGGTDSLYNNIFINRRSGGTTAVATIHYAIENKSTSPATGWSSNYNFIGSTNAGTSPGGNIIGLWNATQETTWSGWQGVSGDGNSKNAQVLSAATHTTSTSTTLNANELFANDSTALANYSLNISLSSLPSIAFISNLAVDLTSQGVTTDINGTTRCPNGGCPGGSSAPDIGSEEFGSPNDAGITAITTPCPGSSQTVYATIKNYGAATLNSVTVNWSVNGTPQSPASFSSMSLATNATVVKAIGTYTFTTGTSYTIDDSTSSPNGVSDGNTSNDDYTLTGYVGFPSTVYIGTGAGSPSYATYSAFFTAINNSSLANNVTAYVQNSTVEPVTSVYLNAQTICSGTTDTIFIKPASATVFTDSTSDNFSSTIGFNGASNVVIDGSYGGSGRYLRFVNYNSTNSYGTVLFQNSANNITIKNSIVDLQCSAASTAPVILFSTSASGSTGNSYITLSGDSIGDIGAVTTYYSTSMIQSLGTSGTPNHDNTISNNSIFNFTDGTRAYGVNITSTGNGSNWIINGNSIFNTDSISGGPQTAISFLPGSSSTGDSISNNYVGGSASFCGNTGIRTKWVNGWTGSGNTLNVLYVDTVNAGTVAITGNTVQRIWNYNSNYSGIVVFAVSGSTNATIANNLVGNVDGIQADELVAFGGGKSTGTLPGYILGVHATSTGTTSIVNNKFYYLQQAGTHTGGFVTGVDYTGSGTISVTNNLFFGMQSATNYSDIAVDLSPTGSITGHVDSNTVAGLYSSNIGEVVGLHVAPTSGSTCTLNKNSVYGLYNGATASTLAGVNEVGLYIEGVGTITASNNYVSIENYNTLTSSYYTNAVAIWGILDAMNGGTLTCAYNSVYIGGSQSGSSNAAWYSYAFTRQPVSPANTITLRDNIFMNNRTGAGNHYAIQANPTTGWTSTSSNYNFLSSLSTSTLGSYGGSDVTEANWPSTSGGDANSKFAQTTSGSSSSSLINPNELFTNTHVDSLYIITANTTATAYINATGTPVSGITTDIYGNTRSGSTPDIGADEFVGGCTAGASITAHTNVACYGGSTGTATVTATGSAPYTYSWTNSATTSAITGLAAGSYTVTVTATGGCAATASITLTQPSAALVASATKTDVLCFGASTGTATSTTSGGTTAYTYAWTGGSTASSITAKAAGTYTLTVTDANSCTSSASVTINQPASALSASASHTDVSCNGGSNGLAASTTTGGTTPYTYAWTGGSTNSSITGLSSSTYTLTVTDAHSCTSAATVSIGQPSALVASAGKTDASCNGGSNGTATSTSSGGSTPYTYSWSSGETTSSISGKAAATYTLTVTDAHSCTSSGTVTIGQPSALVASASKTDASCNGGSNGTATSTSSGGSTPYTYSWSSGETTSSISGKAAATYTLTVTDAHSCTSSGTVTIGQASALVASAGETDASCNGGSNGTATSTSSGGTTPYTYSWSSGSTASSITGKAAGTYTLTVTDAHSCTSSGTVTIGQPSALSASASHTDASCAGNDGTATSTTSGGTTPYTYSWSSGETTSSISGKVAGTYTLTVTDAHSCTSSGTATIGAGSGCGLTYTVKVFLQGYYIGSGNMSPFLKLLNASSSSTAVDTVTIELHTSGSPTTAAYSYTGILQSNGNIVCSYASAAAGTYYIVVKHRNSLTTYSASTQTVNDGGSYDFTTGAGQAYGSGNVMANVGSGVYAIYSGDINGDGSIDSSDKLSLQSVLSSFTIGVYDIHDITGDGFVDEDDLRILQNNVPLSLTVQHP